MTEPRKVHCYSRVDRPYESVRRVLHGLLAAGETAASLSVHSVCDQHDAAGLPDLTRATVGVRDEALCESSNLAAAEIYASALSSLATQIEIEAHCVDRAGGWVDATTRRIAETHVHALLERVVERVRLAVDTAGKPEASSRASHSGVAVR